MDYQFKDNDENSFTSTSTNDTFEDFFDERNFDFSSSQILNQIEEKMNYSPDYKDFFQFIFQQLNQLELNETIESLELETGIKCKYKQLFYLCIFF
jgi:hypothetical protein